MRKLTIALAFLMTIGSQVVAETVTGSEFEKNVAGYPCFLRVDTDANKQIVLQLSEQKDVWSLNFLVLDRAAVYRRFFTDNLRDDDAFSNAFDAIRIGERRIKLNRATLFEVQLQDVDASTSSQHSIVLQHNVTRALGAMTEDGIEIEGLVSLDGTITALSEFRSCSYVAMGLRAGQEVMIDTRQEFRLIFESSFEDWIENMGRAERCNASRFDETAVSEVIAAAAEAFHPGITNVFKRQEYRKELEGTVPMAKLIGGISAVSSGCMLAKNLADLSRFPMDKAIEYALE